MPDLVFANFTDLRSVPAGSGLVTPDTYHPPLSIDVLLPQVNNYLNSNQLSNILSRQLHFALQPSIRVDWSSVYETTSVDTFVASLNAAVCGAREQTIPRGYSRKSKFPPWFSHTLRHYIAKKNYFHRRFKNKPNEYFYDRFTLYRKLVISTFKSDISNFRKQRSGSIRLNVDGKHLAEPTAFADAFAKHFQSVHNNCCSIDLPRLSQCSEFLSLVPVSDADVCKAIKRLKPSKCVGLDDIPGFIIKCCSAIFTPILRHIFNLSLAQQYFPAAWKEAAVVPVFKRQSRHHEHLQTHFYSQQFLYCLIHYSKLCSALG
jgi:hypothetical protein